MRRSVLVGALLLMSLATPAWSFAGPDVPREQLPLVELPPIVLEVEVVRPGYRQPPKAPWKLDRARLPMRADFRARVLESAHAL